MNRRRRGYDTQLLAKGATLAPRVEEDPPFCWFCPTTTGKRTREHIFPQWLLKTLCAEDEFFTPTHQMWHGGTLTQRGPIKATALVAGEVCDACNSGWMSQLEVEARKVLFPSDGCTILTSEDQGILARWFTKTAVALNISQNFRLLLPSAMRHALQLGMPPDLRVFLARHVDQKHGQLDWRQGAQVVALVPAGRSLEDAPSIHRVHVASIRIVDLVGVIVYSPPGGWAIPWKPTLQIWPATGCDVDRSLIPILEHMTDAQLVGGHAPIEQSPNGNHK